MGTWQHLPGGAHPQRAILVGTRETEFIPHPPEVPRNNRQPDGHLKTTKKTSKLIERGSRVSLGDHQWKCMHSRFQLEPIPPMRNVPVPIPSARNPSVPIQSTRNMPRGLPPALSSTLLRNTTVVGPPSTRNTQTPIPSLRNAPAPVPSARGTPRAIPVTLSPTVLSNTTVALGPAPAPSNCQGEMATTNPSGILPLPHAPFRLPGLIRKPKNMSAVPLRVAMGLNEHPKIYNKCRVSKHDFFLTVSGLRTISCRPTFETT